MSLKWERVKAWDDAFFPAWAWPAKALLRALSSIWLAVILLSGVVLYGILASVPIGMLALIPTWLVYAATFVVGVGGACVLSVFVIGGATRGLGRAPRFAILMLAGLAAAIGAGWAWIEYVWPILSYHPATEATPASGFRLFTGFVQANRAITLRRLPGVEMTELEFYSAWPMRALLLLFVLNMVIATIRRISFEFVNLGVLTVHAGIVLIALGATYYSSQKREGDTLLQAGPPAQGDASGDPTPGMPVSFFYDNTQTVLVIDQWRGPEQRRLASIPRYNDYGVTATPGPSVWEALGRHFDQAAPDGGTLDVPIEPWRGSSPLVDPDINFRMIGYASYATAQTDWVRVDPAQTGSVITGQLNPLRLVTLAATLPENQGQPPTEIPFFFLPKMPPHRVAQTPAFAIEYRAAGMASDPTVEAPLPEAGSWGLWVRIPGAPPGAGTGGGTGTSAADGLLWTLEPGRVLEVAGYRLEVTTITPEPPFPIVTEGYRGATCPVAQVRVTPPPATTGATPTTGEPTGPVESQTLAMPYTRWVYSRYPEINQDLLELSETDQAMGMPARRDADPAIEIRLIDASKLQVTIEEGQPTTAGGRVVIRQRGGGVRALDIPDLGQPFEILPAVTLAVTDRWSHAEAFERPVPVPPEQQEREAIGTHQKAMVAIEVSIQGRPGWSRVAWLPFVQYLELGADKAKQIDLPDGRRIRLIFGRRQHRLPGFQIRLVDFQMLAYDHRGAPRDYQSIISVEPTDDGLGDAPATDRQSFEPFTHITKLNAPLTAPWIWNDSRGLPANVAGRLVAGMNPDQFKLSQAGWDAEGWRESQAAADQGLLPRPFARFTILGVGNSPGIHIIALGGILMALGIPWAFYIKPWLVRNKRDRIKRDWLKSESNPAPQPVRGAP